MTNEKAMRLAVKGYSKELDFGLCGQFRQLWKKRIISSKQADKLFLVLNRLYGKDCGYNLFYWGIDGISGKLQADHEARMLGGLLAAELIKENNKAIKG